MKGKGFILFNKIILKVKFEEWLIMFCLGLDNVFYYSMLIYFVLFFLILVFIFCFEYLIVDKLKVGVSGLKRMILFYISFLF